MSWLRSSLIALTLGGLLMGPAVAQAQRTHTVRSGQSMSRIARRYRVRVWDLAAANRLQPSSTLRVGQTLRVPARGVTYVRAGQTLSHIAHDAGCSVDELRRLNRLRRTTRLRIGRRLILPGYEPPEATAPRDWGSPGAPGVVRIRRRAELATVRLLDDERRVTREGLEALAQLMRRHEDDDAELPHPRLASLLAAISDHFGGREIVLVSGRREAGGYTRESSRHTSGRATDIRVQGVSKRTLWNYCRTLSRTGCGYYPRSTFIHVDVRAHAAQWVDWSRPGRRPRYGNLRRAFPRMCRQRRRRGHRRCRREGRRVTAAAEVPVEPVLTEEAQALYPAPPAVESPDAEPVIDEYETASDDEEAEAEAEIGPGEAETIGG